MPLDATRVNRPATACGRQGYTVGFLFSPSQSRVLLIRKRRPAWQEGKLNGVGGHIEPGEWPHQCMVREFKEETGLDVPEWQKFAMLKSQSYVVHCYTATDYCIYHAHSMTDEQVGIYAVEGVANFLDVVPNLRFLVPLAMTTADVRKPVLFNFAS